MFLWPASVLGVSFISGASRCIGLCVLNTGEEAAPLPSGRLGLVGEMFDCKVIKEGGVC